MSTRKPVAPLVYASTLIASLARADGPSALWLEPSLKWYGIDGNWSSTSLFVGEPIQELHVLVSTSISELWVVETSGCGSSLCDDDRGGVFNRSASSSWSPMGLWQLGLSSPGFYANGDYGMETVVVSDSVHKSQTSLRKLIVAGINDTTPYQGLFGLGMTPGNFGGVIAQSPIASMVEQSGIIPSHSYGYTPGAYYAGTRGVPMSLTLGGYDENRFEPHDVQFSLNATTRQPHALVRAITASVSDPQQAPSAWPTSSRALLSFNESVTALIDSSTPYLWLPPDICDRFVSALNLTWNETFGLYLFSDLDNLQRYRAAPDLSFTFTLSSSDYTDNLGTPLDLPGVVNITVSSNAFIQTLRYPFGGLIPYGSAAVPYFPLKRAEDGGQAIIGRSFLQEAYIITNYEKSRFSLHKARFPADPLMDTSIQTIAASPSNPYPGPPEEESSYMAKSEIAGAVVGSLVGIIIIMTALVLARRRYRSEEAAHGSENESEEDKRYSAAEPDSPISPMGLALFRMKARSKFRPTRSSKTVCKKEGKSKANVKVQAYEVGADCSHERHELPARPLPVELDAIDTTTAYFVGSNGEDTLRRQSSYDRPEGWARPLASPSGAGNANNKALHVPPRINVHCQRSSADSPSPASSPSSQDYPIGVPSPITPPSDGSTFFGDYPSPVAGFFPTRTLSRSTISNPTMAYTPPSPTSANDPATIGRSVSSVAPRSYQDASPLPPHSLTRAPIQRTPIDTSNIVCLGPLPENVQLPHPPITRRNQGAQLNGVALPPMPPIPPTPPVLSPNTSRRQSMADTLGSNYTLEEEARAAAAREAAAAFERIDGFDIVHIPQMAHQRYSWEEERRS
ncbi:acid protease [Xylariaceae sp. FL0594]|nr:acid protease [Xylariaceae sp. FL0594]